MSVILLPKRRSSTCSEHQPPLPPPYAPRKPVSFDTLWNDAVPVICLAVITGTILWMAAGM